MPVKDQFIVESKGKTFVLYAGLLDLAHERGLMAIKTTLIQIPNELNAHVAIVHAEVQTEQGTFTGLGDADSSNVSRMMVPHLIRMAETRAKARALRDAVNVGVTAFEELGEEPETGPAPTNGRSVEERISHAQREFSKSPEGQDVAVQARSMAPLHKRYAELAHEASTLGVKVHPVPHNATVDEFTDLGVDLRHRIDEAKAVRR